MKITKPSFEVLTNISQDSMLRQIEQAARTCYKSEDKIAQGSAEKLVKALIKSGHHSVLEHVSISVKIVCDRGVSHELVRHRLCSFSQESTRYANYGKEKFGREITVIRPFFWEPGSKEYSRWHDACLKSEFNYMMLLNFGASPQQARSVLPNSLKTEVVMTANIREWRHIFRIRSSVINKTSHPQMREIADMMLAEFANRWPVIFGDIGPHAGKDCLGPGCIYCDEDDQ